MSDPSLQEALTAGLMPLIERWVADAYQRGYREGVAAASRGVEDRLRMLTSALGIQEGGSGG